MPLHWIRPCDKAIAGGQSMGKIKSSSMDTPNFWTTIILAVEVKKLLVLHTVGCNMCVIAF